jgi:hypothetical protein
MDLIDAKYIGLLSSRLEKFKQVKTGLYNFRCPICGDSQKNKNKTRGYLYGLKNNTNFKCHNCGASLSFNNFLKKLDTTLHKQYTLEKFKSGFTGKNFVVEEPKFEFKAPVFVKKIDLPKASENELSKKYLRDRKLDPDRFFYAEKFKEWTNTQIETFPNIINDEPRIIIPLRKKDGSMFAFQGRSLLPSKVKYITIMLDEEQPKIYGLDGVNENEEVYVTEGPFDSEFIPNSLAMCGADIILDCLHFPNRTFIYDNEPRNKEIVRRYEKCISNGEKIVIWPKAIQQKDINDMVLAGLSVMDVLKLNTYKGLEAKIKLNEWKKV